jgi:hypothetical protein
MYMTSIDTLEFARELQAAEFTRIQAEALTRAIANHASIGFAAKADLQDFATKKDFAELDRKIEKVDLQLVRIEQVMELKLAALEKSLTIKLGSFMVVAVSAVAAMTKFL